jgi:hypothetical protein
MNDVKNIEGGCHDLSEGKYSNIHLQKLGKRMKLNAYWTQD